MREVIKMEDKEILKLSNEIKLLNQSRENDQKTIEELKSEIKNIKSII